MDCTNTCAYGKLNLLEEKKEMFMKVKKSWIWLLSQAFFILTIGLCVYIFVNFLIVRASLPPGVCPIQNNRTLIYIAIVLALISFILAVIEGLYKKSDQRN